MSRITQVAYQGWESCYQIKNDQIELIVTTDVGPRILHLGFVGGPNELIVLPKDARHIPDTDFRFYGGHRLWHAPEAMPRTYQPDNQPVTVVVSDDCLQVTAPVEGSTAIQKQMTITLSLHEPHAQITHCLANHGVWPVELAAWAITMCASGGVGIMPLPPARDHDGNFLPLTSIALWPYTRLTDPRWMWGDRYIMLHHDSHSVSPQKAGVYAPDGWIAYANQGHLLLKTTRTVPGATYPDRGSNLELFTNGDFLEIETLGPLTQLLPGQEVEHIEDWYLFDNVTLPASDGDVEQHIVPLINSALRDK